MLCRLGGRWLRPLPVLQLGAQGPRFARTPTGGAERSAVPVWAVASVSAVSPSGPGGWYEALAASAPVQGAEELLLGAHSATGLPWWSTVVLTTVALRTAVTLPLAAYQHYILAKVENLQPEIKNIARHLNQEVAVRADQLGWSKRVARLTYLKNMRRLVSELYVRDNCHPFKATVLVWIQIPMWIFMSVALRNLSTGAAHAEGFSVQEQLATGGVLWFPDLTALDSTWILPVSVGVINLLIVEIFAVQKIGMSRFQMYATYFVRAVSVLMIPVAATVPSAGPRNLALKKEAKLCAESVRVHRPAVALTAAGTHRQAGVVKTSFTGSQPLSIVLYWLCSSFMGLSQNLLLRSPRFRQLCRVPVTKGDSDTPYKDLFAAFYAKFISRK